MDQRIFQLFRTMTHGVYVIGVTDQKKFNAFTAAWVMQASFNPLLVVASINPSHTSYALLKRSGVFTINILTDNQIELARHFGRPASLEKLNSIKWTRNKTGAPVLCDAMSYLECEISHESSAGDHVLVVGKVIDGAILNPTEVPLNYRNTREMDGSVGLYPEHF